MAGGRATSCIVPPQASAAISGAAAAEPLLLGVMWHGMSQIAVGEDCHQLGETVETLESV